MELATGGPSREVPGNSVFRCETAICDLVTVNRPVTVNQSFTNVTILAITSMEVTSLSFLSLYARGYDKSTCENVREFPDNNNHKGAQSTLVACGL